MSQFCDTRLKIFSLQKIANDQYEVNKNGKGVV